MAHKALVAIVGPSGTGKSTSLRNLDPTTTRILDLERKGFPFRDSSKFTILPCGSPAELDKHMEAALKDETVKVIVMESITKFFEMQLRLCQSAYKGYDVYTNYNKAIGNFLDRVKNNHAVIVFTAIDEIVKIPQIDGEEQSQRRIWVQGKQWEGKIEKEMLMVLYTEPRRDPVSKKIAYYFMTNTDGTTSAKTPMLMFENQYVENDLAMVLKVAEQYYTKE